MKETPETQIAVALATAEAEKAAKAETKAEAKAQAETEQVEATTESAEVVTISLADFIRAHNSAKVETVAQVQANLSSGETKKEVIASFPEITLNDGTTINQVVYELKTIVTKRDLDLDGSTTWNTVSARVEGTKGEKVLYLDLLVIGTQQGSVDAEFVLPRRNRNDDASKLAWIGHPDLVTTTESKDQRLAVLTDAGKLIVNEFVRGSAWNANGRTEIGDMIVNHLSDKFAEERAKAQEKQDAGRGVKIDLSGLQANQAKRDAQLAAQAPLANSPFDNED